MATPDWLHGGAVVRDPDGERWIVRAVGPERVELGHADRGRHELLRRDLVTWVEEGDWTTIE